MHFLIPLIRFLAAPFVAAIDVLGPLLAQIDNQPYHPGHATGAAFAVSAATIAVIAIVFSAAIHGRLKAMRLRLREERARHQAEERVLELLLGSGMQGAVVMKSGHQERVFLGEGRLYFEMLLDSSEGPQLIRAMDRLREEGESFAMTVRVHSGVIAARGVPVADRAVLYMCEQHITDENKKYLEILEALPVPVWTRRPDMALEWANPAFLRLLGLEKLKDALASNASIDWAEHEPASASIQEGAGVERAIVTVIGGEKRNFDMMFAPIRDQFVCGLAQDKTLVNHELAEVMQARDGYSDLLEQLPLATAVFDTDRRLMRYNSAYAELWGLLPVWLDAQPTLDQILTELRDKRRLPEQRDFSGWKSGQLKAFSGLGQKTEQVWHMVGGRSIRINSYPHLLGGIFVTCEDISERIRMESGLNLLTQVQKATLDTLDEGVGIFGPDGRLVLHNAMFAKMWKLGEDELAPQPHFAEIANLCAARIGHDGIWGIVSCGINSASPERFGEWGRARRADGRILSLSLSRLPNGATIVTFADMTDLERFGSMLKEEDSHVAA